MGPRNGEVATMKYRNMLTVSLVGALSAVPALAAAPKPATHAAHAKNGAGAHTKAPAKPVEGKSPHGK